MPSINSRDKGAVGERELANIWKDRGYETRRGQQRAGGPDSPDVIGLPRVHVEAKRTERLNIHAAVAQSRRDAGSDRVPIVAHRRNRDRWLVTLDMEPWLEMYEAWCAMKDLEEML